MKIVFRRSTAACAAVAALPLLFPAGGGFAQAQNPAPTQDAGAPAGAEDNLPIRDVVLFTSGVGYFQRTGPVDGAATVPLVFRTGSVDDILKSMILLDPQGKVQPVTYTSQEPVEQALKSFGINVGDNLTLVDLLKQLRGVRVQLTMRSPAAETISGTVMSVETHTMQVKPDGQPPATEEVSYVNLLTAAGIQSVNLQDAASVKILDEALAHQLEQALGVLSTGHNQQQKTVTLHFGDGPARTVSVGYVTEAPIWKTSYRLALQDGQAPYLQGWAVVDNSTDHDWNNVRLTLVSGQPISFIQDLYTPLYIPRPVVPAEVQANPYPQLSEENVMDNARRAMGRSEAVGANGYAPPAAGAPEAPAAVSSPSAGAAHGGGATTYTTTTNAPVHGPMTGNGEAADEPNAAALRESGVSSLATGQKAGELFQYRIATPVTIGRQQSAMIPIVTDAVKVEKLDVYNADVNADNPENGAEMTNNTPLHLKAGPLTLFDANGYSGDARMPELEPGQTQLITYAVDLGITGVRHEDDPDEELSSLSIKHGVLTVTNREQVTTKYTFKSKLDKDRVIMVEQPAREGWNLKAPAKADEKTRNLYRFRVAVPSGKSVPFQVTQAVLDSETTGLVDADLNTLMQYRQNSPASAALKAALGDIVTRRQKIAEIQNQVTGQKAQLGIISTEQDRIRKNMGALDKNSALYKRYVSELNDQEDELARLRTSIDRLEQQRTQAQADLIRTVNNLDVDG